MVKKLLIGMLAATLMVTGTVGCAGNEKTVVTIEGEKISEPLYRLYLWTIQQQFESITPNIWDMDLEGKTTEEVAKDRALDSIKVSIAAQQKAKELGIEPSKEEQETLKQNGKDIMTNRADLVKDLGFTQKDVEQFLGYGFMIDKVHEKMRDSYQPNEEEITKEMDAIREQYEKVTAKHVLIMTKDEQGQDLPEDKAKAAKALAQEVLAKAVAGEDMAKLAKTYSQDPGSKDLGGEYTFGKGEMVPEFEKVGFETGKVGEVYPELIETAYGYHIMKVEKREKGDEAKIKADSELRVKARFAEAELTAISEGLKIEKAPEYDAIHILRKEAPVTPAPSATPTEGETTPNPETK